MMQKYTMTLLTFCNLVYYQRSYRKSFSGWWQLVPKVLNDDPVPLTLDLLNQNQPPSA